MKSKYTFIAAMISLLIILSSLILMRYSAVVEQFNQSQRTLMQMQAEQAARDVHHLVGQIRHLMSAISIDELWLSDFIDFSRNTLVQEALANKFRLYFPKMKSYVIADKVGLQIGGDNNFFIEASCQADIHDVAEMFKPNVDYFEYKPYIHPKPDNYHFDIMMPVYAQGRELIFFMSFDANWLVKTLRLNSLSAHYMYLLRNDVPGLIEVSTEAVRDKLQRDIKLNQDELDAISALVDVPHTKWQVAVIENPIIRTEFLSTQRLEKFISFLVMLVFWSVIFWFGMRYENSRLRHIAMLDLLSNQDDLTKLHNRRKLLRETKYSIEAARSMNEYSALLYIDLNDFKHINDDYGHDSGDRVLIACANRLQHLTRADDVVARIGGDEFVVLLNSLGQTEKQARNILMETEQRLRQNLTKPYQVGDVYEKCIPSIGVVLITPDANLNAEKLLSKVDAKMYENKQNIKNAASRIAHPE